MASTLTHQILCCSLFRCRRTYLKYIEKKTRDQSISVKIMSTCTKCRNSFPAGSRITEFDGKQYHPECFACADCHKAITSQFYPFNSDYLCSSCHETRFPRKRCSKCGSVITSAGITFGGASYHAACFLCVTCKQPISAQSKISMVDGQPCCVKCFEDKHAKRCSRCQKAIVADVEYLEFEDKYWHKECFTCSKCQKCIAEESFYQDGNLILCKDCI